MGERFAECPGRSFSSRPASGRLGRSMLRPYKGFRAATFLIARENVGLNYRHRVVLGSERLGVC